jgi:predicted nucleic acid binding AN1-type Zn finger protein
MVQLFPGLLYVLIITVLFTALLVSFTAVSLLSQARAIVRKRYIGSVFSNKNVKKVAKRRPILATMTAVLLNLKDVESNRLLTTFKRPAAMRLYQKCFFVKPYFSSGAYLVQNSDIKAVSIVNGALNVTFMQEDRVILLQCRGYNLSKWRDSLNALILNHK